LSLQKLSFAFLLVNFLMTCAVGEPARRRIPRAKKAPVEVNLDDVPDADVIAAFERESRTNWTTPSMGVSVPGGFGADWGYLYSGVQFSSSTFLRNVGDPPIADGLVFAGFGLGNAQELVGLETGITVTDVDPFLEDWSIGFKLHRVLPKGFGIAVGVESAVFFGAGVGDGIDSAGSYYAALSKYFVLQPSEMDWFSSVLLTAGVGIGRFRSWEDQIAKKKSVGYFGSVGLRVLGPLAVSAAWTGFGADFGVGIAPFRSFRLNISLNYRNAYFPGNPKVPTIFELVLVFSDSFKENTFPFFNAQATR